MQKRYVGRRKNARGRRRRRGPFIWNETNRHTTAVREFGDIRRELYGRCADASAGNAHRVCRGTGSSRVPILPFNTIIIIISGYFRHFEIDVDIYASAWAFSRGTDSRWRNDDRRKRLRYAQRQRKNKSPLRDVTVD